MIDRFASGLADAGMVSGDRVALLAPPSAELYALALALLARGQTVVLIDGALGARRALRALADAAPDAIVGTRRLLAWWPAIPALRRARRFAVEGGWIGITPLAALSSEGTPTRCVSPSRDDGGLLTFSSGTTGRPRCVRRTHDVLLAQHAALRAAVPAHAGQINMPMFPAAVLHNLCCGIATVLPPIDPRAPAPKDAERMLAVADAFGVTSLALAPALAERLVRHLEGGRRRAFHIHHLVLGGAPVSRRLCERLLAVFPDAHGEVVYGATEAEPIAAASLAEIIAAHGEGYLAGSPCAGEVGLVNPDARIEDPAAAGALEHSVRAGEVGEVIVRGRHVASQPSEVPMRRPVLDGETRQAERGREWHRTGDLARRDTRGRLWLVGRVGEGVRGTNGTVYPYEVEAAAAQIDGLRASALVAHRGAKAGELAVVLDESRDTPRSARAMSRVRALLLERGLAGALVRVRASLPVDARHFSKVDRAALRRALARP
jgi:acyl-CoA synthetase (AMP-forming)/AMP-acid ligase II